MDFLTQEAAEYQIYSIVLSNVRTLHVLARSLEWRNANIAPKTIGNIPQYRYTLDIPCDFMINHTDELIS